MVADGFCVWDVVQSCQRPGSLDQDIQKEVPNDIRGFCQQHESIRRIVLANGGTGSSMFVKHFRDWIQSGELVAADHEQSQKAFGRAVAKASTLGQAIAPSRTITLISALSVSPAAATYSYETKRDFWEEHVYRPGLADALNAER
jgi:G:T/U-mismatch repair DNA glycosylase